MARTRDFAEVIRAKLAGDPDLAEAVKKESFNTNLAIRLYDLRTKAGLSQQQLAERMNTSQSVISRLEDADYDGHSLYLLKKIANALGKELRIEFDDPPEPPSMVAQYAEITTTFLWDLAEYPVQPQAMDFRTRLGTMRPELTEAFQTLVNR
jgi:transcriptional regulator with XRE-family HTH domain